MICIELERDARAKDTADLTRRLLDRASAHEITREIDTLLYHPSLPVDVRHNSKIFREKLAVWATERLR